VSLTFPTRHKANKHGYMPPPGHPDRAQHCQCGPGRVSASPDDTCLHCGRHAQATISQTWQRHAAEAA
jgi:hypothetical protein